jgi:hypothetical protein
MPPSDIILDNSIDLDLDLGFEISGPQWREFTIEQQEMSNWCWAAATCAIAGFYDPANAWKQKSLVAAVLNMPICATAAPPPVMATCNKQADASDSLTTVNCFSVTVEAPLDIDDIIRELSANRPFCCQLWHDVHGGHLIIVYDFKGKEASDFLVSVADPFDACCRLMDYNELLNNYQNSGASWIRTYLTSHS